MKIYKVNADFKHYGSCRVDYDACALEHSFGEHELLINFDGTPKADGWWPRIMVSNNDGPIGTYVDKLSADVIIMEQQGIRKLEHLFGPMEVLPLQCNFGDYWAINLLTVLDCVDYEKSKFKCFRSTPVVNGRPHILKFEELVFLPEKIRGHHVFKIIDKPKSMILVDDVFVQAVKDNHITGFKFDFVWEVE